MKTNQVTTNRPVSILDPRFKYIRAANTDIRKTFERIRKEMAKQDPNPALLTKGS